MKTPLMFAPVIGLTVVLAGCGTSAPPQASDQPTVTVIEGTLATPHGAGTVSLAGTAASAPLSAAGQFSLTLPTDLSAQAQSAAQVMSALQCSGSLQSSDASAKGYLVTSLDVSDTAGSRTVLALSGSKSGVTSRSVAGKLWLYTDKVTTLSGSVDCAKLLNVGALSSIPVNISIAAKAGWNVVDMNIGASANILGQLSASGWAANSSSSATATTWRTNEEVKAQIGF